MASNNQLERKLTAILSADVKGYSRLMAEDEVATIRMLTAYRGLMASHIQKHRGQVIDTPGDNLLAEFGSVLAALSCAVEVQRELAKRNAALPDQRKMEFRIGINLGDVVVGSSAMASTLRRGLKDWRNRVASAYQGQFTVPRARGFPLLIKIWVSNRSRILRNRCAPTEYCSIRTHHL
jgi:hypothetical protein